MAAVYFTVAAHPSDGVMNPGAPGHKRLWTALFDEPPDQNAKLAKHL